jgi:hypothetical protein
MHAMRKCLAGVAVLALGIAAGGGAAEANSARVMQPAPLDATQQAAQSTDQKAPSALTQQVGSVKTVDGNTVTLKLDSGSEVSVTVQDTTKIVQVAPGSKDLKSATAIHLADLQPGDRVLVRGKASTDAKSMVAVGIIAMKRTDVDAKHAEESEDWVKRGTGGLASAVDPATGTITISTTVAGATKTMVIHTTKATMLRRYAPDSVKFDEAKEAPFADIKPGDQLRARGTKNADGSEFAADEIVSGTFRNIAGIINAVDLSAKTITLTDLITKKTIVVKVTDESQLRKIPAEIAQRIAMRLKGAGAGGGQGAAPGTAPGANAAGASAGNPPSGGQRAGGTPGMGPGGQPGGGGGGGRGDFQQIVNRLPAAALSDFQKGDAVMAVSTQGSDANGVTAITVVGGVEPIMMAAAGVSGQAMTLSPWSLGAPAGDAGGGPQ